MRDPSAYSDHLFGMSIESDSLYLAGSDQTPGPFDAQWRIERRRLPDGRLDATFGVAGVITNNPSNYGESATLIGADSFAIYVVGLDKSFDFFNHQWRIEKRCQ